MKFRLQITGMFCFTLCPTERRKWTFCLIDSHAISSSTPRRVKVDKSYSVSQSKRRNEEDFQGQTFKGNYILLLINIEHFFRLVGWERGSNLKSFWSDPLFCFKHFKWIYSYIRLFQRLKKFLNFSLPAKDKLRWNFPCSQPLHPCSPFIIKALSPCIQMFLKKGLFSPFSTKYASTRGVFELFSPVHLKNAKTIEIR